MTNYVPTLITLSEAAKHHILTCLGENKEMKGVRFGVKKTGCSGLSYTVDYVAHSLPGDITIPLTATYSIYIDELSFPYLKGMEVDYVKEGLNARFVFNNPNQKGKCGCGISFTV